MSCCPHTCSAPATIIPYCTQHQQVEEDAFTRLAAACLHSVLQTASNLPKPPPSLSDICEALDCGSADEVEAEVIKELKATLKDDLASTSVSG